MDKKKDSIVSWSINMLSRNSLVLRKESQNLLSRTLQRMVKNPQFETSALMKKESTKCLLRRKKSINLKTVIALLSKRKEERSKFENKIISSFLSENFDFFKKLKESADYEKLESLVGVLTMETFEKGDRIIRMGEDGNKFYIILEGTVGVYKTRFIERLMTVKDFTQYLNKIKNQEFDEYKLHRVEEENSKVYDISVIKFAHYDHNQLLDPFVKRKFLLEEEYKQCECGQGSGFGEIALIRKQKRSATIIAMTDCQIASIEKYDYNRIIKEQEEKRFNLMIEEFRGSFSFLKEWSKSIIAKLINSFSKVTLNNGEYLYEQNQISDCIYFSSSGTFELYSYISLGSFEKLCEYVYNTKASVVNFLDKSKLNKKTLKPIEVEAFLQSGETLNGTSPLAIVHEKNSSRKFIDTQVLSELMEFKIREEEMRNPRNMLTVKIRTVDYKECLGIEEALELKRRYCSVKCTSTTAELHKIRLSDFVYLLALSGGTRKIIQEMITEKKDVLIKQLKNYVNNKQRSVDRKVRSEFTRVMMNENQKYFNHETPKPRQKRMKKIELSKNIDGMSQLLQTARHLNPKIAITENPPNLNSLKSRNKDYNSISLIDHFNLNLGSSSTHYKTAMKSADTMTISSPCKMNRSYEKVEVHHNNNSNEYKKILEKKSYQDLTSEISKITGRPIIKKRNRKIISLHFAPEMEKKLIEIHSYTNILKPRSLSTCMDNGKVIKTFEESTKNVGGVSNTCRENISELNKKNRVGSFSKLKEKATNVRMEIPVEIKMKYYKLLRMKKRFDV